MDKDKLTEREKLYLEIGRLYYKTLETEAANSLAKARLLTIMNQAISISQEQAAKEAGIIPQGTKEPIRAYQVPTSPKTGTAQFI